MIKLFRYMKMSAVDWLEKITLPASVYSHVEPFFAVFGRRKLSNNFPHEVRKILVVQPDLIGDVLLTAPFLRELRAAFPAAWITLVVEPGVFDLVELCPHVDEIFQYDCKNWRLYWRWKFCFTAAWLSLRQLFWRRFDMAIFPHWDVDHYYGTMVAYLSGATYRLSYSEAVNHDKRVINKGYNILLTHALEEPFMRHEVEHNLYILRALGLNIHSEAPEIWLGDKDEAFADSFLQAYSSKNRPLIAICTGGSHPCKRWPVDRFLAVAQWLIAEYDAAILLVGSAADSPVAEILQANLQERVINATGRATLRQSAALIKRCKFYVGNDTGPMHMAAAVSLPVVAISCHHVTASPLKAYSPTRFGPWGVPHRVLQPAEALDRCATSGQAEDGTSFCACCISDRPHCILGVTIEAVKQAVSELIGEDANPRTITGRKPQYSGAATS